MSIQKYIIQNCSNSKKYRINIDGSSHLSIGETWKIECDVIEDGCYQILKDDSNVKIEINVDECSFIEYETCFDCETDLIIEGNMMVEPTPSSSFRQSVTPTNTPIATPSVTPTLSYTEPSPFSVSSVNCFSATTQGEYTFTDCCGTENFGNSINTIVCVDTSLYYSGLQLYTTFPCSQNCDEGPLSVIFSGSPDCGRPGSIYLDVEGGLPPYTVQNTVPGTLPSQVGNGPFNFSNLDEGTYVFNIWDSTLPEARQTNVQVVVPPCLETTITANNIQCNGETASITVSGSSIAYPIQYTLYYNGLLYQSYLENTNTFVFSNNIFVGDYYVTVGDSTGQLVQTDTVTVQDNNNDLYYELNLSGSSACANTGAAQVVNISGGPAPYTYVWSNGQTSDIATGLGPGDYSVLVTDARGCSLRQTFVIELGDELGRLRLTTIQPNCFDCDGIATLVVTGGTPPYYFSGSTGQVQQYEENEEQFILSGLCSGSYQIIVNDSEQCTLTESFSVQSNAGFTVVGVNTLPADCGNNGQINIEVSGTLGILTYSITGDTGITETITKYGQSHDFTNLPSGTYDVEISDRNGNCVYTIQVTVDGEDKFTITTTATGTTCGLDNGSVLVTVTSGTTSIQYPLSYVVSRVSDGQVLVTYQSVNSDTQLITDIPQGSYDIEVTDNNGCIVTSSFQITQLSKGIEAILYGTNCVNGNDGTATLLITNGTPPYQITWSNGVTGQQNLSGLSGGTYSVTIEDSDGCTLIKSVDIECGVEIIDEYILNDVCEDVFETGESGIKTFEDILYEAYQQASIPGSTCVFNYAEWLACLTISGSSYPASGQICEYFYSSNSLDDVPTLQLWEQTVQILLSQFPDISWTTNIENNTYTITSNCDGDDDPLKGAFVELSMQIFVDVTCSGNKFKPTPSITPTPTNTPNITPTPTPTQPQRDCELIIVGSFRQLRCELDVITVTNEPTQIINSEKSVKFL